jgi:hypothetical protein
MEKRTLKAMFMAFLMCVVGLVSAQTGTDKFLYENAAGTQGGAYTLTEIKTFTNTAIPNAALANSSVTLGGVTVALGASAALNFSNLTGSATVAQLPTGIPNANLANNSITLNGTSVALGGTRIIALAELGTVGITSPANGQALTYNGTSWVNSTPAAANLQNVTNAGNTTTTAVVLSGGLTSSGVTTISGKMNVGVQATATASFTLTGSETVKPINSTSTVTVTVTAGTTDNPIIELPILSTSTGSVVVQSSASETFNGASTYTVTANSQNTTLKLRKISSTAWLASLNQ